jgi:hypothetical protein
MRLRPGAESLKALKHRVPSHLARVTLDLLLVDQHGESLKANPSVKAHMLAENATPRPLTQSKRTKRASVSDQVVGLYFCSHWQFEM